MVTTDTAQLSRECNSWREVLRSCRNEMGRLQDELQKMARSQEDKEVLTEVEHFHNQFYIQQINIHDLKQAIKVHERKLLLELATGDHHLSDELIAIHEDLHDQFQFLQQTIQELKDDFATFNRRS
jgi:hypothetical protein